MTGARVRIFWRYALVVIWMFVIFQFSSEMGEASGGRSAVIVRWLQQMGVPGSFDLLALLVRKAAHAAVYAVLAMISYYALRLHLDGRRALLGALLVSMVYAISDEVHQLFVPGRSGSVRDVLIDVGGATVGLGVAALISCWRRAGVADDRRAASVKDRRDAIADE